VPAVRRWQWMEEEEEVSPELGVLLLKLVSSMPHISEVCR